MTSPHTFKSETQLASPPSEPVLFTPSTSTPASPPPKYPISTSSSPRPGTPRRQSSFAQSRPDGSRRTSNRVHFAEQHRAISPATEASSLTATSPRRSREDRPRPFQDPWLDVEEEEWLGRHGSGRRQEDMAWAPLLADIQAPSVTVAMDEFNPEDLLESARPKSNLRSAFMNMANSIIGAGIIGQPYAIKQAGLLTGITLLVILTVAVDWTIRLIVTNSKLSGTDSFQATVQHCFGRPGLVAISIAQWAFAFGGMLAFCIIIGDTIPFVMAALFPQLTHMPFLWLLTNRKAIIILFTLGISFPLSLYRDIAKLAKASTLALLSMVVIIITVITQGPRLPADLRGPIKGSLIINSGVTQAIGVISFAFVCHHNSLLIYGSLRKPTMDRFAKVTHYSTGVSCLACMLMGLAGFLTFGDMTQGNILNNFPVDNIMVNVARLCFGLNMLTTLPLEAFVCREVMTLYFYPNEPFNKTRHVVFTTGLVVSAMAVSLFLCDLGVVFELVGATSACVLAYILPPLCFVKLTKRRTWQTYAAFVCVAFGCTVFGLSIVLAVIKIIKNEPSGASCM